MKILLTGSTGYIGKRLLPVLIELGHEVVCCARDVKRFNPPQYLKQSITVLKVDLLDEKSLESIPKDIDGAYYLVHSMSASSDYQVLEKESAINFRSAINKTQVQHVVYLSGIVNNLNYLSILASRKTVELELNQGSAAVTVLRAAIIVGSGSASFEIIRDLCEKLPL